MPATRLHRGVLHACSANSVGLNWEDLRGAGKVIDVRFTGVLHDEQKLALDALTKQDNGVLSAATAFGKTVVGAALIGEKRVNTLILVHRKHLMQQWMERLTHFLTLVKRFRKYPGSVGEKSTVNSIGEFGGGKDTRGGVIDIAIIQSIGTKDNIKPWIGDYGMIIVDECHHIPAVSFEQVLKKVRARYCMTPDSDTDEARRTPSNLEHVPWTSTLPSGRKSAGGKMSLCRI